MPKIAESWSASLREAIKQPAFLGMLAAPFVTMGVNTIERRRNEHAAVEGKAKAYKEMLTLHPHLRKRTDGAEVARIYNSIYNASPHMARDPLVAGAWVDNVLENKHPGMNSHQALLNAVKDLSGVEKHVGENQQRQRQLSGTGAMLGTYAKDFGAGITNAQKNNVGAYFDRENTKLQDAVKGYRTKEDDLNKRVAHGQQFGAHLKQREEAVAQREAAVNAYLQDLERLSKNASRVQHAARRLKTASRRTELGQLLASLKV